MEKKEEISVIEFLESKELSTFKEKIIIAMDKEEMILGHNIKTSEDAAVVMRMMLDTLIQLGDYSLELFMEDGLSSEIAAIYSTNLTHISESLDLSLRIAYQEVADELEDEDEEEEKEEEDFKEEEIDYSKLN